MTKLEEQFVLSIDGEPFVITREFEKVKDDIEWHRFHTEINGKPLKLNARLETKVIEDMQEWHGLDAVKELTTILLTELEAEIRDRLANEQQS